MVRYSPPAWALAFALAMPEARARVRRNLRRVLARSNREELADVFRTFSHFASCLTEALAMGGPRPPEVECVVEGASYLERAVSLPSRHHLVTAHTGCVGRPRVPSSRGTWVWTSWSPCRASRTWPRVASKIRSRERSGDQGCARGTRAAGSAPAVHPSAPRRRARHSDRPCAGRHAFVSGSVLRRSVAGPQRSVRARPRDRSTDPACLHPSARLPSLRECAPVLRSRSNEKPLQRRWPWPPKRPHGRWSSSSAPTRPIGSTSVLTARRCRPCPRPGRIT